MIHNSNIQSEDIAAVQQIVPNAQVLEKFVNSNLGPIFRIQHPEYGECALKILRGKVTQNKSFLSRFLGSINQISTVQHNSLVSIHKINNQEPFYILREWVEGETLYARIQRESSIHWKEVCNILLHLVSGLGAAFEVGLLHRNLKPRNILIDMQGQVKIADFSLPPTISYHLSPEQCRGKKSDIRSDIYAIGTIFFQALVGKPPFFHGSMKEIMSHHIHSECPDLQDYDFPLDLMLVLQRMLEKDPEQRQQNYSELYNDIQDLITEPVEDDVNPMTLEILPEEYEKASIIHSQVEEEVEIDENEGLSRRDTDRIIKKLEDEIDLTKNTPGLYRAAIHSNEELPEEMREGLERATDLISLVGQENVIAKRNIRFPRALQYSVIEFLQKKYRRECWLIKDLEDQEELEVEIDIEQALVLYYLYQLEDKIQNAIQTLDPAKVSGSESWDKSSDDSGGMYGFLDSIAEVDDLPKIQEENSSVDIEEDPFTITPTKTIRRKEIPNVDKLQEELASLGTEKIPLPSGCIVDSAATILDNKEVSETLRILKTQRNEENPEIQEENKEFDEAAMTIMDSPKVSKTVQMIKQKRSRKKEPEPIQGSDVTVAEEDAEAVESAIDHVTSNYNNPETQEENKEFDEAAMTIMDDPKVSKTVQMIKQSRSRKKESEPIQQGSDVTIAEEDAEAVESAIDHVTSNYNNLETQEENKEFNEAAMTIMDDPKVSKTMEMIQQKRSRKEESEPIQGSDVTVAEEDAEAIESAIDHVTSKYENPEKHKENEEFDDTAMTIMNDPKVSETMQMIKQQRSHKKEPEVNSKFLASDATVPEEHSEEVLKAIQEAREIQNDMPPPGSNFVSNVTTDKTVMDNSEEVRQALEHARSMELNDSTVESAFVSEATMPEDQADDVMSAVANLKIPSGNAEETLDINNIAELIAPEQKFATDMTVMDNSEEVRQALEHARSMELNDSTVESAFVSEATMPEDQADDVMSAVANLKIPSGNAEETLDINNISELTAPEIPSQVETANHLKNFQEEQKFATDMTVMDNSEEVRQALEQAKSMEQGDPLQESAFVSEATIPEDQADDVMSAVANLKIPSGNAEETLDINNIADLYTAENQSQNATDTVNNLKAFQEEQKFATDMTVMDNSEEVRQALEQAKSMEQGDSTIESAFVSEATMPEDQADDVMTAVDDLKAQQNTEETLDSDFISEATIPEDQAQNVLDTVNNLKAFQEEQKFATDMTVMDNSEEVRQALEQAKSMEQGDSTIESAFVSEATMPEDQADDVMAAVDDLKAQQNTEETLDGDFISEATIPEDQAQNVLDTVNNLKAFQEEQKFATDMTVMDNSEEVRQALEQAKSMEEAIPDDEVADSIHRMEAFQENEKQNEELKTDFLKASPISNDMTITEDESENLMEAFHEVLEDQDSTNASHKTTGSFSFHRTIDEDEGFSHTQARKSLDEVIEKPSETISREDFSFADLNLDIEIDFNNHYQTMAWLQFVKEHQLKKIKHFNLKKEDADSEKKTFSLNLSFLQEYKRQQSEISSIKAFFEGDYEINELGRGGMGMVLKLITKNNSTILSIRPENVWARDYFGSDLQVRSRANGEEVVYAEINAGTTFVVKVAPKKHEESLIREANILENVAWSETISPYIVGMIQQGRLMSMEGDADAHLGYYMMLEYASQGSAEQIYSMFPEERVTSGVAFTILYAMAHALVNLKKQGIIHRDIKPENVLFDHEGVPKLSDFGLSISTEQVSANLDKDRRRLLRMLDAEFLQVSREREQLEEKLQHLQNKRETLQDNKKIEKLDKEILKIETILPKLRAKEEQRAEKLKDRYRLVSAEENALKGKFAGSLYYAAPEQFEPSQILTHQCDVYQLGAVIYTILTGQRPVEGNKITEVVEQVLFYEKKRVTDSVSGGPGLKDLSDLVFEMMKNDPQERIKVEDVIVNLNNILLKNIEEYAQLPDYDSQSLSEDVHVKIQFARSFHQKCLKILRSCLGKIYQNQNQKIPFSCPNCGKSLHIYPQMAGRKGNCPKCTHPIVVKLPSL